MGSPNESGYPLIQSNHGSCDDHMRLKQKRGTMTSVYLYDTKDKARERIAQFETLRDAEIYARDTAKLYPACDVEIRDGEKIIRFLCSKIGGGK